MHIMQLDTCAVLIKFKNLKKCCIFFVVLGNGQVLLGMPDIAACNIINLNIDSIQAEIASCKTENRKCKLWLRAVQTWTQGKPTNKMQMVKTIKMFQIIQTIQLIISFPLAT